MRRLQPANEDGIALIMALGVMLVLSVTFATVIFFANSNSQQASRSSAGQKAYALAEAGLNNAAASIAWHYYDSSGTAYNSTSVGDSSWNTSVSQQSASSTAACTSSSTCVTWSATYQQSARSWSISATGRQPNPTGPTAGAVTRTLTGTILVKQDTNAASIWQWVYSGATGTTGGCDMTIPNSSDITAPVYVQGNLCLLQSARIDQPSNPPTTDRLVVGGKLDLSGSNSSGGVGGNGTSNPPASTWLSEAHVVGSCVNCKVNQSGGNVWVTGGLSTSLPSVTFTNNCTPPMAAGVRCAMLSAANWQDAYSNASPGPNHTCGSSVVFDNDTTMNDSLPASPAFNITGSTYTCKVGTGELSYNSSTRVLTVNGTVFFDGNIQINPSGVAVYTGKGNIYARGTVFFQSTSKLCGKLSGSNCDWTSWDPDTSMLIIAAYSSNVGNCSTCSIQAGNNSQFQGGLYGQSSIDVGQSRVQGPLVSPATVITGQQSGSSFPVAHTLAEGYPLDPYILKPLQNVSY